MRSRFPRTRAWSLVVIATLVASRAGAQGFTSVTPFVSYARGSAIGDPSSAGLSVAMMGGNAGLRASGAILLDERNRLDPDAPRGWDIDGDLLLRLGGGHSHRRFHDDAGLSLVPFGFVGLGGRRRPATISTFAGTETTSTYTRTWSYGGGLALALSRALEISGEARWRNLRDPNGTGWHAAGTPELRLGVALNFGE